MLVRELIAQVRDITQDIDSVYFSESELLNLYNECKRYLATDRQDKVSTIQVELFDTINTYTIPSVIRFIRVTDSNGNDRAIYPDDESGVADNSGIILVNNDEIYVNVPENDVTLNIKAIVLPDEDNLNDTIRSGDENSYKYYMLSKAYEKDNDMEQFQKAQYFANMFNSSYQNVKKNARVNYINKTNTTKGYYF